MPPDILACVAIALMIWAYLLAEWRWGPLEWPWHGQGRKPRRKGGR